MTPVLSDGAGALWSLDAVAVFVALVCIVLLAVNRG